MPNLRRQARELVVGEPKDIERRELADFRRQGRELAFAEFKPNQRRELADLPWQACERIDG
jgi:hypothetical protein